MRWFPQSNASGHGSPPGARVLTLFADRGERYIELVYPGRPGVTMTRRGAALESGCVLVTEASFHSTYLLARWLTMFGDTPGFGRIFIRDNPARIDIHRQRWRFHSERAGVHELTPTDEAELDRLYGPLSEPERALLHRSGIPALPEDMGSAVTLIGTNINSPMVRCQLHRQYRLRDQLLICIFLDQVLAPWWIELTKGRIVNAHSAVLPHARGMFAVEQVAASGDIDRFRRCAGATVHFVDEGVDTGPIIRAERFANPFAFESISDCKAASYLLAFDLLVGVVRDLLLRPDTFPAGIVQPRAADRNFHSSEFDQTRRLAAADGYLLMKHHAAHNPAEP